MKVGASSVAAAAVAGRGNGADRIDSASGGNAARQGTHSFTRNPHEDPVAQQRYNAKQKEDSPRGVQVDIKV